MFGRLSAAWSGLALLALAGTGCLYLDGVNQRPGIEIVRKNPSPVTRGGNVTFEARVSDPDGGRVELTWQAQACAAGLTLCAPAGSGVDQQFLVQVPADVFLEDGGKQRVQHLRVTLQARDDRGAQARPAQELILDVGDAPPRLLDFTFLGPKVAGGELVACVLREDLDDAASAVALTWKVTDHGGRDVQVQPAPASVPAEECKRFPLAMEGDRWAIEVAVKEFPDVKHQEGFVVVADVSPCLQVLTPMPGALLFDQPRRLAVQTVFDLLDPFPAGPAGVARFRWSLLSRATGGARQPLVGATASFVELDPAAFELGEIVQLRVEILDRTSRAPRCADGEPTCSELGNGCLQRQTWSLEVR